MGAAEKLKPLQITDSLIDTIVNSTCMVFETTFGLSAKLREKKIVKRPFAQGDISGTVGLVQNHQEGNLVLSFPKETLFHILYQIYQIEFDELNKSAQDATAEVTNMIYGQIKVRLNENGHSLQMALPNIVLSDNHEIFQCTNCDGCSLDFAIEDDHNFSITLTLN